jgi:hypothetical protein
LLVAIVLIAVAGVAIAEVGVGDPLHACAQTETGLLRLVDSPDDCRKAEDPVSWNQQGPPGPTVGFYVNEIAIPLPDEPPDPEFESEGSYTGNLVEGFEALCDPGDAAVSSVFWTESFTQRTYNPPTDPAAWPTIPWEDPAIFEQDQSFPRESSRLFTVVADEAGTPIGFMTELPVGSSIQKYWGYGLADRQVTEFFGQLVCADLTP